MNPSEEKAGYTTVQATAPKSELADYPIALRAMTQGRGWFEYNVTGYDTVPGNVAQKVIAEAKELLAWSEDQFVVWSDPIHNMDWRNWKTPTALEQYDYYTPIDASMADFIRAIGEVVPAVKYAAGVIGRLEEYRAQMTGNIGKED